MSPEFAWGSVLIGASYLVGHVVGNAYEPRKPRRKRTHITEGLAVFVVVLWVLFWGAIDLGSGWLLACIIGGVVGGVRGRRQYRALPKAGDFVEDTTPSGGREQIPLTPQEKNEVHRLFHHLWSVAGSSQYDKEEWVRLEELLEIQSLHQSGRDRFS